MSGWQRTRTVLNWINLTTPCGLLVARLGRTEVKRGPGGVFVAGGYRLGVPKQECFTVGSVVNTRESADWLLDPERAELLGHETRHVSQYACLGPLFFPLYGLASAWSWLLTGGYGAQNWFERKAGLEAGGYADAPLRGWAARVAARFASAR